ncbi:chromosome segregation protein SMC [Shewanella cyperi]|uniref:Chromosome partition protein Smc n=1 Tax=Shewanella cyperi TaxID=2814292 RepID=A0A975AJX0_9GAMM|nr:chromosome segregation protein SMC [Shewanella cyperi]QSX28757.1 chromosome segregation protein SMC [Shewanella cyperi]
MRLKQIKLAGFKSFVDPTKIPFPNPLTAIIGPNGCGKSNVIDAVRWVMGESSAKHLRGDAMTDVIFNGSSARRPVSVAGVELVFDNSEGRLGGQYASYQELAIKRQVSRDGESLYFLNGQKCRRKDITDLFMGTGLGPRSYAIIEQGTISRLIESKPQELRVFIEEAAGISRYKERRRDTENRIRHTRDNLERLGDIRLELGKQLEKLAIQAEAARRYREYKHSERETHAQLLVMRYRELLDSAEHLGRELEQIQFQLDLAQGHSTALEAELATRQLALGSLVEDEQQTLESFYQHGTEVARLEQQLSHLDERSASIKAELERLTQDAKALAESQQQAKVAVDNLQARLAEGEAQLALATEAQEEWQARLDELQDKLHAGQQEQLAVQRRAADAAMAQSQCSNQQQMLRQRLEQSRQRCEEYRQQQAALRHGGHAVADNKGLMALEAEQQLLLEKKALAAEALEDAQLALSRHEQALAESNEAVSGVSARLTLLQSLQAPEPAEGLDALWQVLEVESGWERAVEALLAPLLSKAVTDQLDDGFMLGPIAHFGPVSAPVNLAPWLARVEFVEDSSAAQARLSSLPKDALLVTRSGELLGQGFCLQPGGKGSVSLKAEAEALSRELEELEARCQQQRQVREQAITEREACRAALASTQGQLDEAQRRLLTEQARLSAISAQQERDSRQLEFLGNALATQTTEAEALALELELLEEKAQLLEEARDGAEAERHQCELAQTGLTQQFATLKGRGAELERQCATLSAQCRQWQTEAALARQQLSHGEQRQSELVTKIHTLELELERASMSVTTEGRAALEDKLKLLLAAQQQRQTALAQNRAEQAGIQEQIDSLVLKQKQEVGKIEQLGRQLESLKLRREGLRGQADSQLGLMTDAGVQLADTAPGIPAHATVDEWQGRLEKLRQKISRLGAINLAAIDEFDEQQSRKNYLDEQDRDLNQALDSLEEAIRKIDRETRTRFRATFDQVNADLGLLFPKVFGGGSAYLALTDDDLLETGVTIMARPPGKKNSTIHLLSGGEKALTALSLVFAIFRLNPAPFCMLDEVDAPLDDANVDRFCRLLQEMSATVQFIYISHNKITMEMADQLVGVTMHEPGVSRIVAVDIEEAVALADAG